MSDTRTISVTLNGQVRTAETDVRVNLADYLRHTLGATGTHVGCEHGVCGACTVIVDDQPVRACLMLAVQADGARIETIEGLAVNGDLSDLQAAFSRHHGLQCGFCTPGMLMTVHALLQEMPDPDERAVREAISGNICRCTGYEGIVAAALDVAAIRKGA